MAAVASVPVVNLLSRPGPSVAGARRRTDDGACLGPLAGRRVAWVGDYNNVARSLAEVGALSAGTSVTAARRASSRARPSSNACCCSVRRAPSITRPAEAVKGADAVHADTWVSMGQEEEKAARDQAFEGFTVDDALMDARRIRAVFLHCLPAYRGLEVTADVIDGPHSRCSSRATTASMRRAACSHSWQVSVNLGTISRLRRVSREAQRRRRAWRRSQ